MQSIVRPPDRLPDLRVAVPDVVLAVVAGRGQAVQPDAGHQDLEEPIGDVRAVNGARWGGSADVVRPVLKIDRKGVAVCGFGQKGVVNKAIASGELYLNDTQWMAARLQL